jgi:DNA-binding GntR family transcriptional regulator
VSSTGTRRPDATGQTYRWLSDRIASGDIEPGSRLKESELAESLGVSRTPVREALRRLAADGLVEMHPNRGAQLVSYTPQEIADMFSVRVTLEPRASALAVPRLDESGLAELAELADRMSAMVSGERDLQRLGELNRAFHDRFLEASGNRALVAAVQAVVRPAVVHRTFHQYSADALARSMAHHQELVTAARQGDPEWAESVMRTHLIAARHTATGGAP